MKKVFILAAVAYSGRKLTSTHKNLGSLKSTERSLQDKVLLNSDSSVKPDGAKILSEQDSKAKDASPLFKIGTESAPKCGTDVSDIDFTLSLQFSSNRLWLMKHHCEQWGDHPISAAIASHLSRGDIMHRLQKMGCSKEQLNVQVIDNTKLDSYPVNHMRNLALSGVKTSHTVLLDVDFMMSNGLYENLMSHKEAFASNSKMAVVVPAFELRRQCDLKDKKCLDLQKKLMPNTKEELVKLLPKNVPALEIPKNAAVAPFDLKGNVHGHGSTLYDHWLADDSKNLKAIKCVTSPRYEPYLAFEYCKDLPPPQEAFSGYGKNKFVWIQQMLRSGYKLMQLNDSFVTHFPHKPSPDRKKWDKEKKHIRESTSSREDSTILNKLDNLEEQFAQWMEKKIPDNTIVPRCEVLDGATA